MSPEYYNGPLPEKGSCSDEEYFSVLKENTDCYQDKVILCPKNEDVDNLNETIISLPGESKAYRSVDSDSVVVNSDKGLHVNTEFLNKQNLSRLSLHLLTVKVGTVMMLLRNLNPKKGFSLHLFQQDYYMESFLRVIIMVPHVQFHELHYFRQTVDYRLNLAEDSSQFDIHMSWL